MKLVGRAISMVALSVILILHAGCAGNTSGGNPPGGDASVPAVPTGLTATAGNAQVSGTQVQEPPVMTSSAPQPPAAPTFKFLRLPPPASPTQA